MLKLRTSQALLVSAVLALASGSALAHCCHDERDLGTFQQSEMRRGLHGLGSGITDESIHADPPTVGGGLRRGSGSLRDGGVGQMRGNGIGSYGAGSIGERGPGGLGSMQNGGLGSQPPRPR